MSKYDAIDDEEELHKLMNAAEDFDERKAIRARLRVIREKARDPGSNQQEKASSENEEAWEAKRKEREAASADVVKMKAERAEEEKARKMAAYKAQGATSGREGDYVKAHESIVQDRQKQADEEKAKKLAAYSKISEQKTGASGEKISSTTVTATERTPGGGTRTIINKKTETTSSQGFGGVAYGKPAAQTARELTEQVMRAAGPGVGGHVTVRTESWNSQDGRVARSENTQSWGAKPAGGPQGAMAAFKKMDNANPGAAPKAKTGLARSPSTIKQILLDWAKMMTRGYPGVEVTNFSSSWNNGLAFCALIHHFFPDAFDFNELSPKKRRYNFTLAFDTGEKLADIAPLLDVDDMVKMKNPDWKCVFTYVQSIYRHLKDHENNKATTPPAEP